MIILGSSIQAYESMQQQVDHVINDIERHINDLVDRLRRRFVLILMVFYLGQLMFFVM